jgi:hypothetical protein
MTEGTMARAMTSVPLLSTSFSICQEMHLATESSCRRHNLSPETLFKKTTARSFCFQYTSLCWPSFIHFRIHFPCKSNSSQKYTRSQQYLYFTVCVDFVNYTLLSFFLNIVNIDFIVSSCSSPAHNTSYHWNFYMSNCLLNIFSFLHCRLVGSDVV